MMHSAELRWFFLGATPTAAKRWFGVGNEQKEEPRVDEYLMFPGCRTLGVKLRQANFQIKALTGGPTLLRPASGVVGRTDNWIKWSIELPIGDALKTTMMERARWVAVNKTRWLRKYSVEGRGHAVEVDRNHKPEGGCNV
jgi:hypothetical protein